MSAIIIERCKDAEAMNVGYVSRGQIIHSKKVDSHFSTSVTSLLTILPTYIS